MAQYVLTIKNETGGGGGRPSRPASPSTENTPSNSGWNSGGKKIGISAYGIAKRVVSSAWQHNIRITSLRTGQNELQQRMQAAYDIINRGTGLIEQIAIGALVGNLPGAIVGAVTGLAFQGIDIMRTAEQFIAQRSVESIGLELSNIRAGVGRERNYGY